MCDYSLMSVPNRLAREDEDLVCHRFEAGTVGLASCADLEAEADRKRAAQNSFWTILKAILVGETGSVPAVCIPPGARLFVMDIPERLRNEIGVGRAEEVTFTQITAAPHAYRDAVRFRNGREILLQRLEEGQRVHVLALVPERDPEYAA